MIHMTSPEPTTPKKESFSWRSLLMWIALALLLRWQVLEPRWIPSGSMLPTLQLQDRILVEKLRPRIARNTHHAISRGTLIVFKPPQRLLNAGYRSDSALIKRVIGIPGDQIEVKNGELFRNGSLIKEAWRERPIDYAMDPVIIKDHQLWVLGDNRNSSLDSHLWGPLPEEKVIGTAVWRYWPLKSFGPIRFPDQQKIENSPSLG